MISEKLTNDGFQMIIKTIYIYFVRKNKNLENKRRIIIIINISYKYT